MIYFLSTTLCLFLLFQSLFAVHLPEYLLNKKVESSFNNQDFDTANHSLNKLIEKKPENGKYYHNLAQSYLGQNQTQDAITQFEKAIPLLEPEFKPHAKLNLAAAQLLENKADVAKDLLIDILKNDPTNQIAKHNLEIALQQQQSQEQQNQEQQNQEQQNQEQQRQEQQNQEQQNQEQQNQEQQSQTANRGDDTEKEQAKKKQAYAILETLSQREKNARKHYLKKTAQKGSVDYDW